MALDASASASSAHTPVKRAASLPRRLTFTTDSAQQQYQTAMKSVQEYLRAHMTPEQLETLGVSDQRARYYFEEIQQYLAHRLQHETQRKQQSAPMQPAQQQREPSASAARTATTTTAATAATTATAATPTQGLRRRDSELLVDIDAYLDELDPALFDAAPADAPLQLAPAPETAARAPPRPQRSCSYIKEMQEEARLRGRFAPYALKKPHAARLVD